MVELETGITRNVRWNYNLDGTPFIKRHNTHTHTHLKEIRLMVTPTDMFLKGTQTRNPKETYIRHWENLQNSRP